MTEQGPTLAGILEALDRGASLTDRVYDRLSRGLIVGMWKPGERLSARAIAREMGVSLTPVREAMLRLANEGALELTEARSFQTPILGKGHYGELLRIRLALEPMAASLAAQRITPAALDAVEVVNERMAELLRADSFAAAYEADSEFHLAIYDAAGQPLLRSMIASLLLRAGPTRTRLSLDYRKALTGYNHHRRILSALRACDATRAEAELADDISDGAKLVIATLDGRDDAWQTEHEAKDGGNGP